VALVLGGFRNLIDANDFDRGLLRQPRAQRSERGKDIDVAWLGPIAANEIGRGNQAEVIRPGEFGSRLACGSGEFGRTRSYIALNRLPSAAGARVSTRLLATNEHE
jgi:hypothetical protein